jgi:hypothetical protein
MPPAPAAAPGRPHLARSRRAPASRGGPLTHTVARLQHGCRGCRTRQKP